MQARVIQRECLFSSQLTFCYFVMLRSPVYCMKVMNENLLATGDDDGCVKVNVVQVKRISAQICLGGSKIRRNLYSGDTLANKEIVL